MRHLITMSPSKFASRLTDVCGDCGSLDPSWAIVNKGIFVCDECCSVHRSLGRHISQVKSVKKSPWNPSQLAMVTSLNSAGVNSLWEHSLVVEGKTKRKPSPKDPVHPTKAEFIRAKHRDLQFMLKSSGASPSELSEELHASVRSSNLEISLRLLAHGADPNYSSAEKGTRPLHVAARAGQAAQVELLIAHGADPSLSDAAGNIPAHCAREAGHREIHLRLVEAGYEVTDRLLYFICRTRPDHQTSRLHFVVPTERDCLVRPQPPPSNAVAKLKQLTNSQFETLVTDVYDEVDRRETETVWQSSGASLEHGSVPFLPVNAEFSSMRNQGRQKLGTLSPREFTSLVLDILVDAKRRQSSGSEVNGRGPFKEGDDEPLYDSVASDEDYATAEQLAIMVAQNARGVPLNISEVGGGATHACRSSDDSCLASSSIDDMREQLALSRSQISQLTLQIHRLNNKMDEVTCENKELKCILEAGSLRREGSVRGGSLGGTERLTPPGSPAHADPSRRPVSMYETSSGGQPPPPPAPQDVTLRCQQVTKRLQALWSSVRPHTSYSPLADSIRSAVAHLTAAFPLNPQDEEVKTALCQLNTGIMRLQADCSTLERTSEQMRGSAFSMASAIKKLITIHQEKPPPSSPSHSN